MSREAAETLGKAQNAGTNWTQRQLLKLTPQRQIVVPLILRVKQRRTTLRLPERLKDFLVKSAEGSEAEDEQPADETPQEKPEAEDKSKAEAKVEVPDAPDPDEDDEDDELELQSNI